MSLNHVSDEVLFDMVKKNRRSVIGYIAHGKSAAEPFHIALMTLEIFEKELRDRGFDPTDKRFGRDIIGELVTAKMEELNV